MPVDGWYSRAYEDGTILSGHAVVHIGDQPLSPGITPQRFDEDHIFFRGFDDRPHLFNVRDGVVTDLAQETFRQFAAGGGRWLGATGDRIWTAVSREGTRAWIVEHGGSNNDRSVFLEEEPVAQHQAVNWCRVEGGAIVWSVFGGQRGREVHGRRAGGEVELLQFARTPELLGVPIPTPEGLWLLTMTNTDLRIGPWGAEKGVIWNSDAHGNPLGENWNLNPDACWQSDGSGILVVCNTDRGERLTRLVTMNEPRVDLLTTEPDVVVPPIGRPLWVGFFDGATTAATGRAPGNCFVAVRNFSGPQDRPFITTAHVPHATGRIVGEWVSVEAESDHLLNVEELERRAGAARHRVVAYWDHREWPRWPALPTDSWLCLQGYCRAGESPEEFERDMRRLLAAVPAGQKVALVAQCYTSNAALTSDIRGLVPVYARLARDHAQIAAVLVFSGYGRRTGYEDHAEVHNLWKALAASVTTPQEEVEVLKKPEVTVVKWTLDELLDGREMAFEDRENPELGYRSRVFVRDGSVFAEITNRAGTGVTGQRRPVRPVTPEPTPHPPEPPPQPSPSRRAGFRTNDGLHWLSADKNVGGRIVADRTGLGPWEQFTIEPVGENRYIFRAHEESTGKYVRVDGTSLKADASKNDAAHITIERTELGAAFKIGDKYVCAEGAGGGAVTWSRPAAGPWETFVAEPPLVQASTDYGGRIRTEGRLFVHSAGTFRPRFASALSLLAKDAAKQDEYLDMIAELGFNGLRVFAGALTWAGQTAQQARGRIPRLLEAAHSRRLYVEVTALTDTRDGGYNKRQHVTALRDACIASENTLLEIANETFHPTQDDEVHDPAFLEQLYREVVAGRGVATAIGAPEFDEPQANDSFPFPVAEWTSLHLDRGRDRSWNMIRRIREMEMVSAITGRPVMNNEMIGADEQDGSVTGKQRINDPAILFAAGVLGRIFEVGSLFHAQAGLMAEPFGPVQRRCAEAFVEGARLIPIEERLSFKNARWADSPIADANFRDDDHPSGTVIRAYSAVAGNRGWTVLLGLTGDPRLQVREGWRVARTIAERPGIRVLALER